MIICFLGLFNLFSSILGMFGVVFCKLLFLFLSFMACGSRLGAVGTSSKAPAATRVQMQLLGVEDAEIFQ